MQCGLLTAYEGAQGVVEVRFRTIRPLYFNCSWDEIAGSVLLDFETGREVKGSLEPVLEFDRLAGTRYSDSVLLFSDGACDTISERVGAGFSVLYTDYRFGVRLSDFTSALTSELYAIFSALKCVYRSQVPSAMIFMDSLFSLYHLRDIFSYVFFCL